MPLPTQAAAQSWRLSLMSFSMRVFGKHSTSWFRPNPFFQGGCPSSPHSQVPGAAYPLSLACFKSWVAAGIRDQKPCGEMRGQSSFQEMSCCSVEEGEGHPGTWETQGQH